MVTGSSILLTQVVEDFFRENEFFGIREQACERHTRKGKNIGSKFIFIGCFSYLVTAHSQ